MGQDNTYNLDNFTDKGMVGGIRMGSKIEQEKYFVVVSLPYEGDSIEEFDSEEEARVRYNEVASESERRYNSGAMLIRGTVLEKRGEIS